MANQNTSLAIFLISRSQAMASVLGSPVGQSRAQSEDFPRSRPPSCALVLAFRSASLNKASVYFNNYWSLACVVRLVGKIKNYPR
jgi:hypothetical protein